MPPQTNLPSPVLAIQPLPPELVGRARARKAKAKA